MSFPAYETHFGLSELPFRIVPDVESYVDSKKARAAIATLSGGLDADDEFMALTGDVGVGKTMVARRLLRELDTHRFAVAEVIGARLELGDVLENVAAAFAPPGSVSSGEPLARLRDVRQRDGREAVLVVDEAEDLGADTLHSLNELASVRLDDRGGFHVCLVSSHLPTGLQELRRRGEALPIGAACDLASLDAEDTRAYVLRRLQRAGWTGRPAFDVSSTQEIHACCQGNPARINLLCGRLLLHLSMTRSGDDVRVELVRAIDAQLKAEVSGEPIPELHARFGAEPGSDDDALVHPPGTDSRTVPSRPAASTSAPAGTQRPRVAVGTEIDAMFARAPAPMPAPTPATPRPAAAEENVAVADGPGLERQVPLGVAVESSRGNGMAFADGMVALFKAQGGRDLVLAEHPPFRPPGRAIRWWRRVGSRYVLPSTLMIGGVGLGGVIAWHAATTRLATSADKLIASSYERGAAARNASAAGPGVPAPVAAPGVAAAPQVVAGTSGSPAEPVSRTLMQTAAATLDAAPARAGVGAVAPTQAVAVAPHASGQSSIDDGEVAPARPPAAHPTPSHAALAATPARLALPGARQAGHRPPHGGGAVANAPGGHCSQELLSLGLCVAAPAPPPAPPARKAAAAGDGGEPAARAPVARHCAPAEVALGLCPAP